MSRVRIVGGKWRSRQIQVLDSAGLRPTPDRVRETLFNWLGQDLTGWSCLDLFAGSGVLGFEAASRGAAPVTLVELDSRVHASLGAMAKTLQAEQLELIRGDGLKFCVSSGRTFDLVLLDPPYHKGWLERVEPHLDRVVSPDGWLYVEAEHPVPRLGAWSAVRQGQAGQVYFQLLRREQP